MYWQTAERPARAVRFKRVHPDAQIPGYATPKSAGFDISCIEDINPYNLEPNGEAQLFRTGLVIATPVDHMLFITHRSSTPRKWGVIVTNGIIDQDYCGNDDEIYLQVFNYRHREIQRPDIPAGTRIAQGIFIPISRAMFTETHEMGNSRGGLGSTG